MPDAPVLASRGISLLRADNPGPKTLEGTNTWLLHRDGRVWVVDPGPDLAEHLDAVTAAASALGEVAGIALTHRHGDHADGVRGLLERVGPVPVASSTGWLPEGAPGGTAAVTVGEGDRFGPFAVVATPGHAADHVVFVAGDAAFVGDTVLGTGSVLLVPHEHALRGYLDALRRLRERGLAILLPGHGPVVEDADAKLDEYVAHRLDRERRVVAALEGGARTADELLDAVWDDAPGILRLAAAVTLRAHLDKLADEGRLPDGVELQEFGDFDGL
ncbi:MBL fold metallo-hydrolase [Patulibacter minatonensis]|uniref:MBL fold metallo-hydrolase n=1 Tax=Patulibacter minatonensis TaxID=298163 RepID=UPI000479F778|nr:MBL fold metallo-hydrolase [Patulibacter minatonensis]